jgi:hypothetical protein
MTFWIFGIVVYIILGVCYAIDFFHNEYEDMVQDQGMKVGVFFVLTIISGLMWPLIIVMNAVMDIWNER